MPYHPAFGRRGEGVMDLGLEGAVAFVTGASKGIGKALSLIHI